MWKKPSRPDHAVSQSFNSGVVRILTVTDAAAPGRMPVPALVEKIRLPFEERRVGVSRFYNALQAQVRIERVLRVPDAGAAGKISPQDAAIILQDEAIILQDEAQYRIEQVQTVPGVFPPCLDLTLRTVEQTLEVIP